MPAAKPYVVLLRGVNVGGIKVTMKELREAFSEAGFADVKTILASGNVLLTSSDTPKQVKATCEQVLSETFGYEAWVLVYTPAQLQEIADAYPFDEHDEGKQPYVVFSEDGHSSGELGEVPDLDPAVEQVMPGPHHVLFWEVEKGQTLHSAVGKASGKAKYKKTTTTRNLRTVRKLLA